MNVHDACALTVHGVVALTIRSSHDGTIGSHAAMQRLIYFSSIRIPAIRVWPYAHHFFGPFSAEVATALMEMYALSYVNETRRSGFYDACTYALTPKGKEYADSQAAEHPEESAKIADTVGKCTGFCDREPEARPLSLAAKAHHILASTEGAKSGYGPGDVQRVAKDFDWNVSEDDVGAGISLLQKLGLVRTSRE